MEDCTNLPPSENEQAENEIFVPIKYNKQVLNLKLCEAQELAQKGMKFDTISKDYASLKDLALGCGKSVGEYIAHLQNEKTANRKTELLEKCGDEQLIEHILTLEGGSKDGLRGFDELHECFPKINTLEDLPQQVLDNAHLKGTLLLDEYLRYLHRQNTAAKDSIYAQKKAAVTATGSFKNRNGNASPETAEFLRGLWQK